MEDVQPSIYIGAANDQAHLAQNTEDLQDHRRAGEGTLIIIDDRPLLIKNFGQLYSRQQNLSKYRLEGKYDIPVGYKVITKWEDDEIVFMTEEGDYGPRFKIVYMPRGPCQEDFTILDWNANIAELWESFLTLIERNDGRDARLFRQGPWRIFGVTRDEVQIAIRSGVDNRASTDGILMAADGVEPTDKEYRKYLGYNPETDSDFLWLFEAFQNEPLPPDEFPYIRDGQMFWVNGTTQKSSWEHPHYAKYKKMLLVARIQKPLFHWKDVMTFRIEYLLSKDYASYEEDEAEPVVETVPNVIEMSRIMGVDLQQHPYLVHVLKRALRHYGNAVKEKRKVQNVEDFQQLIQRNQDIVSQFLATKEEEIKRVAEIRTCVQCNVTEARLFCDECKDFFCQGCFERIHSRGRRRNHRRTWVEMGTCAECQEGFALFHCTQCTDLYCRDCFADWHVRGGRRNHVPIILRSINSKANVLPDATPAMGTGCKKVLEQAFSPWFCFVDANGIHSYYNIKTGETKRDMPMEVINEPIEDKVGGGIAGGWAGTWGANMFKDPLDIGEEKTIRHPLGRI